MAHRYYLAPWMWDTAALPGGCWRAPTGTIGLVDLRSLPACGQPGGSPLGFGFFATDGAPVPDGIDFGSQLDATLSSDELRRWKSALGLAGNLSSVTVLDALWDTLTQCADPDGQQLTGPLVPNSSGDLSLVLAGHSLIRSRRFTLSDPAWPLIRRMLQRQYKSLRQATLDGRHPPGFYRKVLGGLVRKYGCSYRDLQPGLPDEPPLRPETTLSETFNTGDSDTLGPLLSWTELQGDIDVVSNSARSTTLDSTTAARADSDLSSADHCVQAAVTCSEKLAYAGADLMARKDSSATLTFYDFDANFYASLAAIYKVISNSYTSLGSTALTLNAASWYTLKGQANGSTLSLWSDSLLKVELTDTAISAGTRCGIRGYKASSGYSAWDSWSAADLAAFVPYPYPLHDLCGGIRE